MEVCRLCLDYIQTPIDRLPNNYNLYETQIKLLLPEIDTSMIPTYKLCRQCCNSLKASYTFRSKCINTEALITEHLRDSETPTIDLNLLKLQLDECALLSNVKLEPIEDGPLLVKSENFQRYSNPNELLENSETPQLIKTIKQEVDYSGEVVTIEIEDDIYNEISNTTNECKIEKPCVNIKEAHSNNIQINSSTQSTNKKLRNKVGKRKNNTKKKFLCQLCNKKLSSRARLKWHLYSLCETKIFICSVCNKKFAKKCELRCHELIHKHKCTICRNRFTTEELLKRHLRSIHFIEFVCESCGVTCSTKTALSKHMWTCYS